jgi:excisionase family DNA binding protein
MQQHGRGYGEPAMLTVPEAARRVGRNPETIRRWIREGKLAATRVGTQYLIDEADLLGSSGGSHRAGEVAAPYRAPNALATVPAPDPLLTTIIGRLVHGFDPARILLFGARANGGARDDSDYELLVILESVADRQTARLDMRRVLDDLPISKEVLVASVGDLGQGGLATWGPVGWAVRDGLILYERP